MIFSPVANLMHHPLATFLGITHRCFLGASFCYIINWSYSVDIKQFLVHYIAAEEKQLNCCSEREFWLTTLTSALAQLPVGSLLYPPLVLQNFQGITSRIDLSPLWDRTTFHDETWDFCYVVLLLASLQ